MKPRYMDLPFVPPPYREADFEVWLTINRWKFGTKKEHGYCTRSRLFFFGPITIAVMKWVY